MYINENCAGCGLCIDECNFAAISLSDGKAVINEDLCVNCGLCAEICPLDAIEFNEAGKTPRNPKGNTAGVNTLFDQNTNDFTRTTDVSDIHARVSERGRCMDRRRVSGFSRVLGFGQGRGSGRGRGSGGGSGSGKGMGSGKGRNR